MELSICRIAISIKLSSHPLNGIRVVANLKKIRHQHQRSSVVVFVDELNVCR